MDLFILILTCIINLALGAIVFLQNNRGIMQRAFGAMTLFICLWTATNYLANAPYGTSLLVANVANRLAFVFAMLVIFSALLFTYFFPVRHKATRVEVIGLSASCLLLCGLSLTTYVSGTVSRDALGDLAFSTGPGLWLYALVFLVAVAIAARNLLFLPGVRDQRVRRQSRYLMLAIATTSVSGLICNVALPAVAPQWDSTRFGPLATIILVSSISYLIVRRGLFDIRLATVRTISYAASLLSLSFAYYSAAYLLSTTVLGANLSNQLNLNPVTIILILGFALAFLFRVVKRFFDKLTDRIFYRDQYKVEDFFSKLGEALTAAADLGDLLERASTELATTFRVEQAFIVVKPQEGVLESAVSAATAKRATFSTHDITVLEHELPTTTRLILTELLADDRHALRNVLQHHQVAVIMPLHHHGEVFGYVALGHRRSGAYTKRDLDTLTGTSNELVIAIQNALSLQEVKDLNATLQQRINAATKELRTSNAKLKHLDEVKDEFMSMASHQLRTPLAGVKGNLSMVLEGDMGPLRPKQKQPLQDAFNASNRMAGLVSDFLNVSRIQTGKFMLEKAPLDLRTVAQQEIESLQPLAADHHMKLRLAVHGHDFTVDADESKLRQVIMNFIDNAIYYSHSDSTITINVVSTKGRVSLTVVDTGIGVPKDQQAQLFKKFFRAKNARAQRPDGTGVGLFLAQKVISAHNGSLIFSSTEGKGSTFGFMLLQQAEARNSSQDAA